MQTSLIEMVRSTAILTLTPEYTQIDGGFDLLIDAVERDCNTVPDSRCRVLLNARVTEVHCVEDSHVHVVLGANDTSATFDSVIVSTTARAASLMKFESCSLFTDKYRALRHEDRALWSALDNEQTCEKSLTDLIQPRTGD